MAELDTEAMLQRFRDRAHAVRNRPLPPVAGEERSRFIAHAAPHARDVVIAGQDRDDATALVIPDLDACRALAKDLDADAAKSADSAKLLREGVAALDKAAGGSFVKAKPAAKAAAVKSLEGQPFFGAVRGKCITSLYDNDMAYKVFGYPGSAWEKGGYITRGFQDLKWLPAPSPEASPKPYMG